MFFFLKTAPVLEKVKFAPPGFAPPFLLDVYTDNLNYILNEDVIFTAEFYDGNLPCTLFIDDDNDFSDCNLIDNSDCLVFGEITSGDSLILEASQSLTWYAQICNSFGCDNNNEGSFTQLFSDSSINEVWADKLGFEADSLSECQSKEPTLDDSKSYCEIQENYPSYDCMEFLTYEDLQSGDDDNPSYALFASKEDCLHGAMKYYFEVPDNLDNITFYWEGYFKNPHDDQAIEGRLYIYNYNEGKYDFLLDSEVESLNEVSYSKTIYYYENLDDYVSENIINFLAWNYEGVFNKITHKECVDGVCIEVEGEGSDLCEDDQDCALPIKEPKIPKEKFKDGEPLFSPPGDWFYDSIYNDYVMLEVETKGDELTGEYEIVECKIDEDCLCKDDGCEGDDWYDYRDNGFCLEDYTCDPLGCNLEIIENHPDCLSVEPVISTPSGGGGGRDKQCEDGKDNDGDGLIDLDDPGCESWDDDDEYNQVVGCEDYCSLGERRCVDDYNYMVCMNRDRDICLEWSNVFVCPSSTTCDGGICKNLVRVNITDNETVVERPVSSSKYSLLVLLITLISLLVAIVGFFFFKRRRKKVVKKKRKKKLKKKKVKYLNRKR